MEAGVWEGRQQEHIIAFLPTLLLSLTDENPPVVELGKVCLENVAAAMSRKDGTHDTLVSVGAQNGHSHNMLLSYSL